ncbi:MAG TPA: helix-hairpin-helix domain-containing protein [Alphaproteobacteria bacterium]|nr:helix-hairpin-helix domain-containing protein [Alphaproteobacteria bacterium]
MAKAKKRKKGKQGKADGGATLHGVVDAATTAVGVASMVYKAVQQRRSAADHTQAAPLVPALIGAVKDVALGRVDDHGAQPRRGDAGDGDGAAGRPDGAGPAASAEAHRGLPEGTVGRALGGATAALATAAALIDLNAASPDALMSLKKIGRKRARKIAAHRPFKSVKQLKKVVPKRVYKAVKHQLTV